MDLGIFDTSDRFSLQSLTAAVNEAPALPTRLASLGIFDEEGITTTQVVVEKNVETLTLITNTLRTVNPAPTAGTARSLASFVTTHLPTQNTITADTIQNLRAFGKASEEETLEAYVNSLMGRMRRRVDATIEYQRVGALKGRVVDADGTTVIEDLFAKFGLTQQSAQMTLNTGDANTDSRGQVLAALDLMEAALGNEPYTAVRVLCGKIFFRKLIAHPAVKKAYELWETGTFLRNDPRAGFDFAGARWEEYRGAIGGVPFIADGEAYLFPMGVFDMFLTRFAPANYVESANTIGLPYYAKQEATPLGKGRLIEVQSNPISLCTRPRAVVKLTIAP